MPTSQTEQPTEIYWVKLIEVYKARLAVTSTCLVILVTLTGFAIQNKQGGLFLLAMTFPPVILLFDICVQWLLSSAIMYKIITSEITEPESFGILFLGMGGKSQKIYEDIRSMPPSLERQRRFRKAYTFRFFINKLAFVLLVCLTEMCLWLSYRSAV